jgi:sulfite exporter TauE/SafE
MTYFLAGLAVGLAGSIHCAGMCGPILIAVNRHTMSHATPIRMLVYHAARLSVYVALGAIAGYTGHSAASAGLGRAIAIVSGVLLLLGSFGVAASKWAQPLSAAWSPLAIWVATAAMAASRRRPVAGHAVMGFANGLLPCGILYAALATSVALGTVAKSMVFMTAFGVGTVPVLVGLTMSATSLPLPWRRRLRLAGPAVMIAAGSLLIARGVLPSGPAHHHEAAILFHQH